MQFPVPSEAFARVEVRGLLDAGCQVSASAFRPSHESARQLLAEQSLESVPISHGSVTEWLRGLGAMIRHRSTTWRLARLLMVAGHGIGERLIALLLLPRAIGIADDLIQQQVDRVHLFWGHYPALVGLALRESGSRIPISMFLGAYDLVKGFYASRLLAPHVDLITHAQVNVGQICRFTGLPPDRINVVYRGICVPGNLHAARRSRPVVLVAERLVAAKRTRDAVNVFAAVVKACPSAELTILGDGPERRRIECQVSNQGLSERVSLPGHVQQREVLRAMTHAQVFLSMSQNPGERLPNAVKEAMAAGCVVVVARSQGIEEIVSDGETGYIVSPGGVHEAACRVVEILENAAVREAIGDRARRRVADMFDIRGTTHRRLDVWGISVEAETVAG